MTRILILAILVWAGAQTAYADEAPACDPPYDPSNILEVLWSYSGTMSYLAHGPEHCRHVFAENVRKVVRESWLLTDGCIEATLKDIDNALKGTYKGKPIEPPDANLSDPDPGPATGLDSRQTADFMLKKLEQ